MHCRLVARRLAEGKVIPFLGAGASLCERPRESDWRGGASRLAEGRVTPFRGGGASLCERPRESDWREGYLPSGAELAAFFAESYAYPEHGPLDLVRVSQYVELTAGDAALYEELHSI